MKKIFLFLLLTCVMQLQAQKTFVLYNLTANTVYIDDLITHAGTLGSYPTCHLKPSAHEISIPPYGTYTMINTAHATRFPFYSPTSVPPPSLWNRQASATTGANMPSNAAWLLGANQVFSWIQVRIGANSKQIGDPLLSTRVSFLNSAGWSAQYKELGTITAPIYTVTIQ